jgi:hypothetical protein
VGPPLSLSVAHQFSNGVNHEFTRQHDTNTGETVPRAQGPRSTAERRRKWYAVKEAKAKERWQASWRYMIRLAEQKNWDDAVISMREIMDQTADKYGCTILDLKSARRTRKYTQARFECYWRARRETALSLPQIGRLMGGRDHTTVLHGCKKYEKLRRFVLFGEHPYKGTAGNAILIPELIITE